MSGDINPNPGPVSASTAGKINCLVIKARNLKCCHKDSTTYRQSVCNLYRFQDLMCAENPDIICVNETWLNQNISNSEILHSGFTIFRRDRSDGGGGGVLIAIKTASFNVKEFKPESEAQLQQLGIIFAYWSILFFYMGRSMKPQVGWMHSIIFCMKFVTMSTIW